MGSCGRILLICEDQAIAASIKEKILKLGDYVFFTDSRLPAVLTGFGQQPYDLIVLKPPISKTGPVYLIAELKGIDPDAVIVVLLIG